MSRGKVTSMENLLRQYTCTYTINYCGINRISCTLGGWENLCLIENMKRMLGKNQLLVENALS